MLAALTFTGWALMGRFGLAAYIMALLWNDAACRRGSGCRGRGIRHGRGGAAPLVYGILLMLFILLLPRGIVGWFERRR